MKNKYKCTLTDEALEDYSIIFYTYPYTRTLSLTIYWNLPYTKTTSSLIIQTCNTIFNRSN